MYNSWMGDSSSTAMFPPPNFVEQTLKDGRSSLIILVVEKYLNLSNNVCFNGKGNRSGQKQDIFG